MLKKIAFLVRDDFQSKFGGDTVQITGYANEFEFNNVHVDYINFDELKELTKDRLLSYDFFLIVNVDRTLETVLFYNYLSSFGLLKKVFVIPIHHDAKAVVDFNKSRAGSLSFLVRDHFFAERVKSLIFASKGKLSYLFSLKCFLGPEFKKKIGALFKQCRGVFCIANGERESICRDFGVDIRDKTHIIYNGVPRSSASDNGSERLKNKSINRDIDVLVSGRIEKRKNQVAIIQALMNTNYNVVFVGALNKNDSKYCEQFLSLISNADNITYVGSVSHDDMNNFYCQSKIHLSASWVEVSSLVDLEAYNNGCVVFSSKNGNSIELLAGKRFFTVDPENLVGLKDEISDVIKNWSGFEVNYARYDRTWSDAGIELYKSLQDYL